jgi:hypothetical protein
MLKSDNDNLTSTKGERREAESQTVFLLDVVDIFHL